MNATGINPEVSELDILLEQKLEKITKFSRSVYPVKNQKEREKRDKILQKKLGNRLS